MFKLAGGSVIAQTIAFLASPVLTRLFAPESFGIAGLFASIVGVIGAVACLRYELALMLPKTDDEAFNLLVGALLSAAAMSLLTALIILLGQDAIVSIFNRPELAHYVWLIPLVVVLVSFSSAATYWISRSRQFGVLAWGRIANALGNNAFALAMGFLGHVSAGILIAGTVVGHVGANAWLGFRTWLSVKPLLARGVNLGAVFSSLKTYRRFPQFAVWSGFLVNFSLKLPVFVIAYFFSPKILGLFVFTQTVLRLPVGVVGRAVTQVFFQQASAIGDNRAELSALVERIFGLLVSVLMLPVLLLSILGPDVFTIVFGEHWRDAGVYAQIMGFSILVQFISSPVLSLFNVLGRQKQALLFNLLLLGLRGAALVAGGLTGSIILTIVFYVVGDVAGRLCKFHYVFVLSGLRSRALMLIAGKAFGLAMPFFLCAVAAKYVLAASPMANLVVACLVMVPYGIFCVYRRGRFEVVFGETGPYDE